MKNIDLKVRTHTQTPEKPTHKVGPTSPKDDNEVKRKASEAEPRCQDK